MSHKEENSVESNAPEERKWFHKMAGVTENPPRNHDVVSLSHTQKEEQSSSRVLAKTPSIFIKSGKEHIDQLDMPLARLAFLHMIER